MTIIAWENRVGDRGASLLANVLRNNTTLRHLKLSNCFAALLRLIGDTGIGDQGAILLADCLKVNTTIETLDLC